MKAALSYMNEVEEKYLLNVVNSEAIRDEADVPEHTDGHINHQGTWVLGSRSIRGMGNIPPKLLEDVFGVRPVQVKINGVDDDRLFFLTRVFGVVLNDAGFDSNKLAVAFMWNESKKDMRLYVSDAVGVSTMRMIATHVWKELIEALNNNTSIQDKFTVKIDASGKGEYKVPADNFDFKTSLEW